MLKNTLFVFAIVSAMAVNLVRAEGSAYKPVHRSMSEEFTTKVQKVVAFEDSDAEFVAYIVDWRGHEVMAVDQGTRSGKRYNVGDTVRCRMVANTNGSSESLKMRLVFQVIDEPMDFGARMEAVKADIAKRRQARMDVAGTNGETLEIRLLPEGKLTVAGVETPLDKLAAALREHKKPEQPLRISLIANEKSKPELITAVMDTCRKEGMSLFTLASEP